MLLIFEIACKCIVIPVKILLMLMLLLTTVIAVLVLCPINQVYFYDHIRKFYSTLLLMILGVKLKVNSSSAITDPRGVIITCNHVSWLDIIVIKRLFKANFISAIEIRSWPLVGKIVSSSGALFINRKNRSDVDRINKEIVDTLKKGFNIIFFPEGRTTKGDDLIPYHSALFESAILSHSLVIPCIIKYQTDGRYTPLASFAGLGFFSCLMNILSIKKFEIEFNILEPVHSCDFSDRRQLCDYVYAESRKLFL